MTITAKIAVCSGLTVLLALALSLPFFLGSTNLTPVNHYRRIDVPRALLSRTREPLPTQSNIDSDSASVSRSSVSKSEEFFYAKAGLDANIKLKSKELNLTSDQTALLLDDLLYYLDLKTELDANRLVVSSFDGSKLRLTMPADPSMANLLRDSLFRQIAKDLPPNNAVNVANVLGDIIDSYFHNYGSMEQDIEVSQSPATNQEYIIRWSTVTLSPDAARVATGALGDVEPTSRSATFSLSYDELSRGEYRYLRPIIDKTYLGKH